MKQFFLLIFKPLIAQPAYKRQCISFQLEIHVGPVPTYRAAVHLEL